MSEKKETKVVEKKAVDRQSFVNRKLSVLNKKSGRKYEEAASRVVQQNGRAR